MNIEEQIFHPETDKNFFNSDRQNLQKSYSQDHEELIDTAEMKSLLLGMKKNKQRCLANFSERMTFNDHQLKILEKCMNDLDVQEIDLIDLPDEPMTDAGVSYLAQIPWLRELNLGDCRGITDKGVKVIGEKLKNLESLSICLNLRVTDITPLQNLTNLKVLDIGRTRVKHVDFGWIKNSELVSLDVRDSMISEDDQMKIAEILQKKNKCK